MCVHIVLYDVLIYEVLLLRYKMYISLSGKEEERADTSTGNSYPGLYNWSSECAEVEDAALCCSLDPFVHIHYNFDRMNSV